MAPALLSLLACGPDWLADDAASEQDATVDLGGDEDGKLALDRMTVAAPHVCAEAVEVLTLSNVGAGMLRIDELEIVGEGWALPEDLELPLWIEPGAGYALDLQTSTGEAELHITGPVTAARVPLNATADAAPEISLVSPISSALVDVGEILALEAWVTDDADDAEDLTVRWRSDLDGEIDAYPAHPSGFVSAEWKATERSPGSHTLTLQVTDTCGNTTAVEVPVCQEGGLAMEGERFTYSSHATWLADDECIRLTPDEPYQTGTAFVLDSTIPAGDVDIEFNFFVGATDGADGFSLTALDADRRTELIGAEGCGLGYGDADSSGCITGAAGLPGWSIEVDTYYNPEVDLSEADHVAMSIDGDMTATLFYAELPELEDNTWHTMSVVTSEGRIEVAIDDVVYVEQALELDFDAHVGFTAATGGDANLHLIDELKVREGYCY